MVPEQYRTCQVVLSQGRVRQYTGITTHFILYTYLYHPHAHQKYLADAIRYG